MFETFDPYADETVAMWHYAIQCCPAYAPMLPNDLLALIVEERDRWGHETLMALGQQVYERDRRGEQIIACAQCGQPVLSDQEFWYCDSCFAWLEGLKERDCARFEAEQGHIPDALWARKEWPR